MLTSPPPAPSYLSDAARAWYTEIASTYALESHHFKLLALAATAWDRAEQARAAIAEHGLVYMDGAGIPRPRPEIAVERDSRIGFARLTRELQLEDGEPGERRPPPLRGNSKGLRYFAGGKNAG
jgi:phage terminase small subunit